MLKVVAIGAVVQSSTHRSSFLGSPVIFPDGYTIDRDVFTPAATSAALKPLFAYKVSASSSSSVAMGEPHFTATISWVKSQPTFTITRSDKAEEKVYTDTKSATTAWRKALEDAARDFPERLAELPGYKDATSRPQICGIRLYGLHLKEIREELMTLPGGPAAFDAAAAATGDSGSKGARNVVTVAAHRSRGAKATVSPSPSQTEGKHSRARSPTPKNSGKKRAASGSRAATEEDVPLSVSYAGAQAAVLTRSASMPKTTAAAPSQKKPRRKPKAEVTPHLTGTDAMPPGNAAETADVAVPTEITQAAGVTPAKRRRTPTRKGVADTVASAPSATSATRCPDCGLTGTPFCAATGKPHLSPTCPACGLSTAFCPVSGQPHAGAVHRENRQRGEVHLPGSVRKPRRPSTKALHTHPGAGGEVVEVIAVATQDSREGESGKAAGAAATAKRTRKRSRADGEAAATVGGGEGEKAAPPRRAPKLKAKESAAALKGAKQNERPKDLNNTTVESATVAADALSTTVEEPAYTYPPLRPPLSAREHSRAAHLLQENWKAQYGDGPVLPAAVAALPFAFVAVKRTPATGPGRRCKGRGGGLAGDNKSELSKLSDHDDGESERVKEDNATCRTGADGDAVESGEALPDTEVRSGHDSAVGSPTSPHATGLSVTMPAMAHPLEVTQITTSAAGKRLSRFLLQYTSERTFSDLLRTSATSSSTGADRRTNKSRGTPSSAKAHGEVGPEHNDAGPQAGMGEVEPLTKRASTPPEEGVAAGFEDHDCLGVSDADPKGKSTPLRTDTAGAPVEAAALAGGVEA